MQFVCKKCFSDKELIGFIVSQGKTGNCDCCKSVDVETVELIELLDFFKELFDNFQVKQEGKSLISLIQGNWNLFSDLNCGHKILNEVLNQTDSTISSSEDLVDFSEEILENINYWSFLKEQLKWERRYFTNIDTLTEDLGWDSFFESKTIVNEDETESTIEIKRLINQKDVRYASEQIDTLFYLLQNPIELTESYTSEMDNLIVQALLYVTQQDTVYGSNANNWQIV